MECLSSIFWCENAMILPTVPFHVIKLCKSSVYPHDKTSSSFDVACRPHTNYTKEACFFHYHSVKVWDPRQSGAFTRPTKPSTKPDSGLIINLKFAPNVCTLTRQQCYLDRILTILNGSNANAINDP